MQIDALLGWDSHRLADLQELGGANGQVEVDVWDDDQRRDFAVRVLRRLGLDPTVRNDVAPVPSGAHIHDTSVLFVRPRQRMTRRFLEQLRDRLAEPERIIGGRRPVGALAAIVAHEPSRLRMPDDQSEPVAPVGERLLMPMPTNEAQESIARRLAQHRNVVVQGPPGTGKTHTIRNLICHLMANGKRVLVVAQKEDPLRVLRDGLPEEIQPLCLAVLGRTTDQLVQLQLAARELADRAATLDQQAEPGGWRRCWPSIERPSPAGHALAALRRSPERRRSPTRPRRPAQTASEVGAWLRNTPRRGRDPRRGARTTRRR